MIFLKFKIKENAEGNFVSLNYLMLNEEIIVTSEIAAENLAIPKVFDLRQNYPNPFNPETVIKYQIAEESFVTLKIYSIIAAPLQGNGAYPGRADRRTGDGKSGDERPG